MAHFSRRHSTCVKVSRSWFCSGDFRMSSNPLSACTEHLETLSNCVVYYLKVLGRRALNESTMVSTDSLPGKVSAVCVRNAMHDPHILTLLTVMALPTVVSF